MAGNEPFGPDVVEAIKRHMNEDHGSASLLICQQLGGQPEAEAAQMTGMDGQGIDFSALVRGEDVAVRLAWSTELTERPQVRAEVVRMYEEARAKAGLEPEPASGEQH
jgi:putative heme iron utilization protein